jgi:hypothetical protein
VLGDAVRALAELIAATSTTVFASLAKIALAGAAGCGRLNIESLNLNIES